MIDNILLKFVYPKKIREVVDELERTGELNSEAVRRANRFVYKSYIGSVIIFLMFFTILVMGTEWSHWLLGLGGIFLSFYAMKQDGKKIIEPTVSCFSFGHKTDGEITHYYYGLCWGVKYSYRVGEEIFEKKLYGLPLFLWHYVYRKGDRITVYYLEDEPYRSVPDIGKLKKYFNFRKEII